MRRVPLAAMLAILSAALVLGGNALLDAGWGSALRSIADRVLPNPEIAMWAPAPEPGSHASSYADATGAGANYVYLVDAADDRGNVRELQLIFFGRESDGCFLSIRSDQKYHQELNIPMICFCTSRSRDMASLRT